MKEINYSGIRIVELFLEKLEQLNEKERRVLINTIHIMNHPVFVAEGHPKP